MQTLHLFHRLLFHGNNSSLHHCALTFVGRLFIILPNLSRGLVSGFDEIFLGGWGYNVNRSKINVSSVSFSSEWMVLIRSDEGLTPETSALETPYDGQFTLSTQVIKPNELRSIQHHWVPLKVTVFIRLNAVEFIIFFVILVRRYFDGGV